MRRLLKITTLVVCGLLVAVVALVLSLRLIVFRHPCDRVQTVLSQDTQGRSVVSVFQACTTIGTSSEGWVDLVLPEGRSVRLFTFVPWVVSFATEVFLWKALSNHLRLGSH